MIRLAMTLALAAGAVLAQSGHWEGAVTTPNGDLEIQIDLAETGGKWNGAVRIPAQGTANLRLGAIDIKATAVKFEIGSGGNIVFKGNVDGEKLSGEMTQAGMTFPFSLKRTGEAKFEKPVANPPLSKELEGVWTGAIDTPNGTLRLKIVLANESGNGAGMMFSLDQGNVEIPIGKITQTESAVTLDVPAVRGGYKGKLTKNTMEGDWSQGGGSMPLKLTKAPAATTAPAK